MTSASSTLGRQGYRLALVLVGRGLSRSFVTSTGRMVGQGRKVPLAPSAEGPMTTSPPRKCGGSLLLLAVLLVLTAIG